MEASVFCLQTDWENREMTPLVGEWYKNVTWSSCLFDPCGPVNWEKEDGNGSLPLIQFFFFFYFLFLLFLFLFLRLFLWSSFFSLFPSSSFFLLLHHLPLFFIEMLGSSESSFFFFFFFILSAIPGHETWETQRISWRYLFWKWPHICFYIYGIWRISQKPSSHSLIPTNRRKKEIYEIVSVNWEKRAIVSLPKSAVLSLLIKNCPTNGQSIKSSTMESESHVQRQLI